MEDLKIKVNSIEESKEAQELFFELGYYWAYRNIGKKIHYEDGDVFIFAESDGILGTGLIEGADFFNSHKAKEITLPQLRDMVVLKHETLNNKVASAEVARQKHSHYKKDVSHLKTIDVYRVIDLFGVESNAVGHAIKKLLCSGQRGAKDHKQDIQEAIDSLNRHLEMLAEDEAS